MTDIKSNIKKTRTIKDASLNTYICSLKTLKKKLEPNDPPELNNTDFLKDYDKVISIIDNDKLTSQKNRLTAILVALNSDDDKDNQLIEKYGLHLKLLSDKYVSFLKQQTKTKTQADNWISYNDLIKVINDIMDEVKLQKLNKKTELNNKQFDLLQQLVILSTYIAFPLRNDLADMKVLNKKDFSNLEKIQTDKENYLIVISKTKKEFHINQFKNQKFMGSKILEVQPKLNKVINLWLKHNLSGWYLVKNDRKTPINPNGITKYLNKIFMQFTKKKISTSMIRHIVISNTLKNEPTIAQNEKKNKHIEDTFLHTKEMNDLYRKIDE